MAFLDSTGLAKLVNNIKAGFASKASIGDATEAPSIEDKSSVWAGMEWLAKNSGGSGMDESFVKDYLTRYLGQYGYQYTQETPLATLLSSLYIHSNGALPGGTAILIGTQDSGYMGKFAATEFGTFTDGTAFSGDALATQLGLTAGTAINSDTDWFKFANGDEVLLVPQKQLRYNVSWQNIAEADCVFGHKKIIIGGVEYKATLLTGLNKEMDATANTNESEWDRFILSLLDGRYANFTAEELGINGGSGSRTWCQNTTDTAFNSQYGLYRSVRGDKATSPAWSSTFDAGYAHSFSGWRPALRFTL